ncbi:hypothetical protein HDU67_002987, partial [Dinochytrium kinnereticum]
MLQYHMLCGYRPFHKCKFRNGRVDLLYQEILKSKLLFPKHVSRDARELLKRMLLGDPDGRADIFEVMEHKWMKPLKPILSSEPSPTSPVESASSMGASPVDSAVITDGEPIVPAPTPTLAAEVTPQVVDETAFPIETVEFADNNVIAPMSFDLNSCRIDTVVTNVVTDESALLPDISFESVSESIDNVLSHPPCLLTISSNGACVNGKDKDFGNVLETSEDKVDHENTSIPHTVVTSQPTELPVVIPEPCLLPVSVYPHSRTALILAVFFGLVCTALDVIYSKGILGRFSGILWLGFGFYLGRNTPTIQRGKSTQRPTIRTIGENVPRLKKIIIICVFLFMALLSLYNLVLHQSREIQVSSCLDPPRLSPTRTIFTVTKTNNNVLMKRHVSKLTGINPVDMSFPSRPLAIHLSPNPTQTHTPIFLPNLKSFNGEPKATSRVGLNLDLPSTFWSAVKSILESCLIK